MPLYNISNIKQINAFLYFSATILIRIRIESISFHLNYPIKMLSWVLGLLG